MMEDSQISARAGEAASEWGRRLRTAGDALAGASDHLQEMGALPVAGYAHRGARLASEVGRYLEETSVETMLGDALALAQRRPLVAVAGSFALAFAAARLFRAGGTKS